MKINPVKPFSRIINACDKTGHGRGQVIKNGRIKPDNKCCLVYSVIGIDGQLAICQSWDIFGKLFSERIPLSNLEPYHKTPAR